MVQAQPMPCLVHYRVAKPTIAIIGVAKIAAVVRIDYHVAVIGKVAVRQRVRPAGPVDRMTADANVGPHSRQADGRTATVDGERRIVRLVHESQARHFAPPIERVFQERHPHVHRADVVVQERNQAAARTALRPRNGDAVGHQAPGDRCRIALAQPSAAEGGRRPATPELIGMGRVTARSHPEHDPPMDDANPMPR